ncbi:MAG: hypothetical protein ACRBCL_03370 [Maritimibacter sp.]
MLETIAIMGVGAFFCGVALFYLVMQRTRKHRIKNAEKFEI